MGWLHTHTEIEIQATYEHDGFLAEAPGAQNDPRGDKKFLAGCNGEWFGRMGGVSSTLHVMVDLYVLRRCVSRSWWYPSPVASSDKRHRATCERASKPKLMKPLSEKMIVRISRGLHKAIEIPLNLL